MWYAILFAILVSVNGPALAQNRPALTWQGEVTGGATLFIQGNRVDVQGRDTGSVDRPTFRFRDSLPAVPQNVEVRVIRGRGRVVLTEHPTAANQYTAMVDIRNNGRPMIYELQFFWDNDAVLSQNRRGGRNRNVYGDDGYRNRGRANANLGGPGQVTWTGDVDNEVFVVFTNRRALTTAVRGRDVGGANADFSAPIPRGDVAVNLTDIRGRGQVELMEQPNAQNGYAAKVRILDQQGGIGTYSFTLAWDGGGTGSTLSSDSGGILTPGGVGTTSNPGVYTGAGLRWSGRVDGTIRVTVRGSRITSERVSGGPIYEERASVGTAIPRRNLDDVDVRKISGRGDVEIVQRPSSANAYTLVFQIEDDDGGADFYDVEITWR